MDGEAFEAEMDGLIKSLGKVRGFEHLCFVWNDCSSSNTFVPDKKPLLGDFAVRLE